MYPPGRRTTPDPLPPCCALLARIVTTDGSALSATFAAGQAAAVPLEPAAVEAAELPFPDPQVALTISPPTTPPTTAAKTSAISSRTSPRPRSAKAHPSGSIANDPTRLAQCEPATHDGSLILPTDIPTRA